MAEEIKLRAERRAGEILKEQTRNKGETNKNIMSQGSTLSPTLKDLKITRNQSSHWQKIAEYRLRVDRKLGAWSKGLEASHGKRSYQTSGNVAGCYKTKNDYFKEIDISFQEMTRKEVIASLPEDALIYNLRPA